VIRDFVVAFIFGCIAAATLFLVILLWP